jgi:hypothetical protein
MGHKFDPLVNISVEVCATMPAGTTIKGCEYLMRLYGREPMTAKGFKDLLKDLDNSQTSVKVKLIKAPGKYKALDAIPFNAMVREWNQGAW